MGFRDFLRWVLTWLVPGVGDVMVVGTGDREGADERNPIQGVGETDGAASCRREMEGERARRIPDDVAFDPIDLHLCCDRIFPSRTGQHFAKGRFEIGDEEFPILVFLALKVFHLQVIGNFQIGCRIRSRSGQSAEGSSHGLAAAGGSRDQFTSGSIHFDRPLVIVGSRGCNILRAAVIELHRQGKRVR